MEKRYPGQKSALFMAITGSGALHYAKVFASLKIKNGISLTPLNCALNAFTFALNDSADALVERLWISRKSMCFDK